MAGKRGKNKVQYKAWFDKDTKEEVQKILKKRGVHLSDEILKLFNQIISDEYKNEKSKHADKDVK